MASEKLMREMTTFKTTPGNAFLFASGVILVLSGPGNWVLTTVWGIHEYFSGSGMLIGVGAGLLLLAAAYLNGID
jgi:hypothetical protein